MPTYNSTTYSIQDGDTTTHTTTGSITITSAQCRWQGVTVTDSTKNIVSKDTGFTSFSPGDTVTLSMTVPDEGQGTFDKHKFLVFFKPNNLNSDQTAECSVEVTSGNNTLFTAGPTDKTLDAGGSSKRGESFAETTTEYSGDTATFTFENKGSETFDIAGGIQTVSTKTTTKKTKDPTVGVNGNTGSADYLQTLDNGEWSPWVSMSDMTEGTNTFDHFVQGSGKAKWEFEYTFDYDLPTKKGEKRVTGPNGTINIRLADPSDSKLKWNGRRLANDDGQDSRSVDQNTTYPGSNGVQKTVDYPTKDGTKNTVKSTASVVFNNSNGVDVTVTYDYTIEDSNLGTLVAKTDETVTLPANTKQEYLIDSRGEIDKDYTFKITVTDVEGQTITMRDTTTRFHYAIIQALDVVDPSHNDASELRFEGPNQTWAYRDDPTV